MEEVRGAYKHGTYEKNRLNSLLVMLTFLPLQDGRPASWTDGRTDEHDSLQRYGSKTKQNNAKPKRKTKQTKQDKKKRTEAGHDSKSNRKAVYLSLDVPELTRSHFRSA